jgi:hypothetical protein
VTQQVVTHAKEKAGQLADQARDAVREQLTAQKDRTAESLGSVAGAIREAGASLKEGDQAAIGQYADQLAGWVDDFNQYLRSHDLNQLVGEVEQFARRRPGLFLGGAFFLGFMAARFLKSSSPTGDWAGRRVDEREAVLPYEGGYPGQPSSWSEGRGPSLSGATAGAGMAGGAAAGPGGSFRSGASAGGYAAAGSATGATGGVAVAADESGTALGSIDDE